MFEADWASIGPGSQWHLKQLGWRKINWTSGADVSSDGMAWSKLGPNERESAKALGFTEKTWTVLNDFARAPLRCMVLARGALRVSVAAAGTQRSASNDKQPRVPPQSDMLCTDTPTSWPVHACVSDLAGPPASAFPLQVGRQP